MKKNLLPKLNEACDPKDELRIQFQYIYFINGYFYASDARILVKIKPQLSWFDNIETITKELEGYAIHANVWKEGVKADTVQIKDGKFICIKKGVPTTYELKKIEWTVPEFDKVIPEYPTELCHDASRQIAINAKLALRLQDAMGLERGLKFTIPSTSNRAILVHPLKGSSSYVDDNDVEATGLIMPVLIEP